jgi:uncharacterized protein GlcG (DUF336 family)
MAVITLAQASTIIDEALSRARQLGTAPMTVAVLDAGGHLIAFKREDRSGILRPDIAVAKAWGALGLGASTRFFGAIAEQRPHLFATFSTLAGGRLVPADGGVLIRDGGGELLGAVGVSGDRSDVDEQCALHGIAAAGLQADLEPPMAPRVK